MVIQGATPDKIRLTGHPRKSSCEPACGGASPCGGGVGAVQWGANNHKDAP